MVHIWDPTIQGNPKKELLWSLWVIARDAASGFTKRLGVDVGVSRSRVGSRFWGRGFRV